MATLVKGRGVTTNVREKSHSLRGISSSSLPTKSPKPSLSSSPPTTSAKTTVKKHASSYVRPTETSKNLDSNTKPNTESLANKQAAASRRRSLAPTSQTQKSIAPIRSSTFSARSSTRAAPERQFSLGKRDVIRKSGDSKSRSSLSKPTTLPSKVVSKDPSSAKVTRHKKNDSNSSVEHLGSDEELAYAQHDIPSLPSKVLSKKPSSAKVTQHKRNDSNNSIENLVSDEEISYTQHDIPSLPEMSEMPDSNEELKDPTYHYFEPKHNVDKTLGTSERDRESTIEKQVEEDETVANQDKPIDQIEEQNDEEEIQAEDKKEVIVICSRSPSSSPPRVASKAQEKVVEKKENQAYNDVIEQTASKLRGKKNKVLALAGAFETVISLQN